MGVNETLPHGVPPAYYYASRVPVINALSVCYITLSIIALLLRYWARRMSGMGFWWDDWFAFSGLPFVIALCGVNWAMVPMGWGRHMVAVKNSRSVSLVTWYHYVYVEVILYSACLFTFKCSALAMYYRIFAIHCWIARCCIALGSTVIAWVIVSTIIYIFRCHPVSGAWTRQGTCLMSQRDYYIMSSIPSIVFSFLIMVLPIRAIWNLKLRLIQKIGLSIVFMLAGLDLAVAIIRLWVATQYHTSDVSWTNVDMFYAGVAEPTIGILSCSIPTYFPLIRALRRKMGWEDDSAVQNSYEYEYRKRSGFTNRSTNRSGTNTLSDGFRPWIGNNQIVTRIDGKPSRTEKHDEDESDMFQLVEMKEHHSDEEDQITVTHQVSVLRGPWPHVG